MEAPRAVPGPSWVFNINGPSCGGHLSELNWDCDSQHDTQIKSTLSGAGKNNLFDVFIDLNNVFGYEIINF